MNVAIVKYNAGNIESVLNAMRRFGMEPNLTDDPDALRRADRVIFPGQGEARSAMQYLRERNLDRVISELRQPVLGICIGLHLMCRDSEENHTECMGLFDVRVKKFEPVKKVPHIGWNTITGLSGPLFVALPPEPFVYFLHSYYAEPSPLATALSEYITPFSAALQRENFHAVQFHPEKSGLVGETILRNFLDLKE